MKSLSKRWLILVRGLRRLRELGGLDTKKEGEEVVIGSTMSSGELSRNLKGSTKTVLTYRMTFDDSLSFGRYAIISSTVWVHLIIIEISAIGSLAASQSCVVVYVWDSVGNFGAKITRSSLHHRSGVHYLLVVGLNAGST